MKPEGTSAHLPLIDLVRGLCALAVAAGHLRNLFLADYSSLVGPVPLPVKLVYFVTGFGHQAVLIFFVLSGYLVGGPAISSVRKGNWSYRNYLVARLTRLLVVLVPALACGFLFDSIGMRLFGVDGIYGGHSGWGNVVSDSVLRRSSLGTYVGNAFFLQTVVVPCAGSNGALWSLSNEAAYYFLFLFLLLMWQRRTNAPRFLLFTSAGAASAYLFWPQVRAGFLIWLFGAALAVVGTSRREAWHRWGKRVSIPLALGGGGTILMSRLHDIQDGAVGIAAGLALVALLRMESLGAICEHKAVVRIARWLGNRSFSLYAFHLPLVVLLAALQVPEGRLQPSSTNLAILLGNLGVVLLFASVFFSATEKHTLEVRNRILRRLGPSEERAASDQDRKRAA